MTRTSHRSAAARAWVGVDLQGPDAVAVQAQRARGRLVLSRLPSPGNLAALGPRTAVALACRESFTRWIEAPLAEPAKARRVLPTVLDVQLPFPLEECQYQFVALQRRRGQGLRALAAAVRVSALTEQLAQLAARGLDPVVVDHEGLALWSQTLRELPPPPDTLLSLVVYFGVDRSTLALGRGREFLSAHALRPAEPRQWLRLVDAQANPAAGAVRWVWTGPRAAAPETESLRRELAAARPGAVLTVDDPAAFLARALATRALLPEPLRCNLRQGALRHPLLQAQDRRRQAAATAAILGSALLLLAFAAAARWDLRRREQRLADAVARLAQGLAGRDLGAAQGEQALRLAAENVRRQKAALQPFHAAFAPSLTRTLAELLALGRLHELRYETLTLGRAEIQIQGVAPDWRRPERLLEAVQRLGYEARLDRREALQDQSVPFTLAGEVQP